ncbi:hypothetical protein GLOIN_2v1592725 [Rhizophagus irregularis DAOM 181602=DAOM 197198]|uniref:Uncharacterized protein n=1 Tax=Rhizophagus irregularis (strain DAOM 181602 / DAOM 197198 / MUCL 43194) TaxID=747089 RepID=A0A2P4Q4X4_RHIID|nr:hypothetical protein GLOIN_2v1592725 [Rhizophagus irregularis DAOM 181602=DAOM 197198]POG72686.1 hypothetical protein GLOIN_2v1592725 [Rhizophagus irregularis DAOM 181602=DAOM 197198]|eukprot:XP_025179552.1 hypothetical protein GLOIN_2v1592725 [Rhizophagus irregularis DAOM 181602=DAOM 197198]
MYLCIIYKVYLDYVTQISHLIILYRAIIIVFLITIGTLSICIYENFMLINYYY